jgi:putative flippase GtrA
MTTISQVSTVDPPQSMAGGCPQSIFRKPRVRPARWAAAAPAGRPAAQSSVDFAVNRRLVFAAPGARPLRAAAARYAGLAVVLFAASYLLLAAFTALGVGLLPAKLLTEVLVVTASYQVQQRTVFTRRARPRAEPAGARRESEPVRSR